MYILSSTTLRHFQSEVTKTDHNNKFFCHWMTQAMAVFVVKETYEDI